MILEHDQFMAKALRDHRRENGERNMPAGSRCPFAKRFSSCRPCTILFPKWAKMPIRRRGLHPCEGLNRSYVVWKSRRFVKKHLKEATK